MERAGNTVPKQRMGEELKKFCSWFLTKKHNFCVLYIVDNLESERAISFWESGANALDCTPGSAAAAHEMRGGEEKTG